MARCSRPFYEADGFARLVTLQLGPGFVRGDRFACEGTLGAGARLTVAAQTATRALGSGAPSLSTAAWRLAAGATLYVLLEPLVAYAAADHRATVDVDLGPGAAFGYIDVIAACGRFARVSSRVRVRANGTLLVHDALDVAPERLRGAVGTALYVRAGLTGAETANYVALAEAAALEAPHAARVRIGIGWPEAGGVSVRALGDEPADVRNALHAIVASLRGFDRARDHEANYASSGTRSG